MFQSIAIVRQRAAQRNHRPSGSATSMVSTSPLLGSLPSENSSDLGRAALYTVAGGKPDGEITIGETTTVECDKENAGIMQVRGIFQRCDLARSCIWEGNCSWQALGSSSDLAVLHRDVLLVNDVKRLRHQGLQLALVGL